MKKIGILFGQEHSFPPAFVEWVNQKTGGKDIVAEFVRIDKVMQGEPCGYDVVIDRISQDVPFYRAWLKNAALAGTAVVNNPFWWSADEKFFNNALATKIGVAVPRTAIDHLTVQVVKGNTVETRRVRVGLASDTNTEILEGLDVGEIVVADAGSSLHDGDQIKTMFADEIDRRVR